MTLQLVCLTFLFRRSFDEGEEAARMIEEQGESAQTGRMNINFYVSLQFIMVSISK